MKPTKKQIEQIIGIISKSYNTAVLEKSWEFFPRTITLDIIEAWETLRGENDK